MAKKVVTDAVRSLRKRLGDTQQQFANRMDMAISTVVRYELSRPPRGRILAQFERLALDHGFTEEALVFKNALSAELGLTALHSERASAALLPQTDRERNLTLDLLWAIRCSMNPADSLSIIERQTESHRRARVAYEELLDRALSPLFAISELKGQGVSAEEVVNRSSLSPAAARLWLRVSDEVLNEATPNRLTPEAERAIAALLKERQALRESLERIRAKRQPRVFCQDENKELNRERENKKLKARRFFFELALDSPANELADRYQIPISTIQTLREELPNLGIPIPRKHRPTSLGEEM